MITVLTHAAIHAVGLVVVAVVLRSARKPSRLHPVGTYRALVLVVAAALLLPLAQVAVQGRAHGSLELPWSAPKPSPAVPWVAHAPAAREPSPASAAAARDFAAAIGVDGIACADTAPLPAPPGEASVPDPRGTGRPFALPLPLTLAAVWLAGALFFGRRFLARTLATARLLRSARPADDPGILAAFARAVRQSPLEGGVRLLTTPLLDSPACFGLGRKAILVPSVPVRDAAALECALRHELVHLERGDPWIALLPSLLTVAFWWNPAAWWLAKELDFFREISCDEEVVRRTGHRRRYADALLAHAAARAQHRCHPAHAPLVAWSRSMSHLRRRIDMLITNRAPATAGRRIALALSTAVALAATWSGQLVLAAVAVPLPQGAPIAATPEPAPAPQEVPQEQPPAELPKFGIQTGSVTEALAAQAALKPGQKAMLIEKVAPGSLAERAGVKQWDILLRVDREEADQEAVNHGRTRLAEGQRVTLVVKREGRERKLLVGGSGGAPSTNMLTPRVIEVQPAPPVPASDIAPPAPPAPPHAPHAPAPHVAVAPPRPAAPAPPAPVLPGPPGPSGPRRATAPTTASGGLPAAPAQSKDEVEAIERKIAELKRKIEKIQQELEKAGDDPEARDRLEQAFRALKMDRDAAEAMIDRAREAANVEADRRARVRDTFERNVKENVERVAANREATKAAEALRSRAVEDAKATREEALRHAHESLETAVRQANETREKALRDATVTRETALRDAMAAREAALKDAARASAVESTRRVDPDVLTRAAEVAKAQAEEKAEAARARDLEAARREIDRARAETEREHRRVVEETQRELQRAREAVDRERAQMRAELERSQREFEEARRRTEENYERNLKQQREEFERAKRQLEEQRKRLQEESERRAEIERRTNQRRDAQRTPPSGQGGGDSPEAESGSRNLSTTGRAAAARTPVERSVPGAHGVAGTAAGSPAHAGPLSLKPVPAGKWELAHPTNAASGATTHDDATAHSDDHSHGTGVASTKAAAPAAGADEKKVALERQLARLAEQNRLTADLESFRSRLASLGENEPTETKDALRTRLHEIERKLAALKAEIETTRAKIAH